jgi:peptidoglycan/LPS O-acetylase OafA/YrhL
MDIELATREPVVAGKVDDHAIARQSPSRRRPATRVARVVRRLLDVELLDNRYPSLHGVRVIAIVSVVQLHVTLFFEKHGVALDPAWAEASKRVFYGMDLFFVLSGFLIGTILIRSIESGGSQNMRRFYLRRIFRTFPPYYLILTVIAFASGPLNAARSRNLWMEYAYVSNYAQPPGEVVMPWGWSLSIEEQFYLAVPLLMLLLHKLRGDAARVAALGALWSAPLCLRLVEHLRHPQWTDGDLALWVYFRTETRMDVLIAGILIAYVQNRWREPLGEAMRRPSVRAAFALPPLACLWVLMHPMMFGEQALKLLHVFAWGTLTSIMYFGWISLLIHGGDGWVQRALSLRVFRVIATLGYGIYLLHIPVLRSCGPTVCKLVAHEGLLAWLVCVGTLLGVSMAGAYVLHVFIEKPSLRVRDWLAS